MIQFNPITPADKTLLTSYIIPGENRENSLSICNLCSWHFINDSSFAIINDLLVLRFQYHNNNFLYSLPLGTGEETAQVLEILRQEAAELNEPLMFFGVLPNIRETLEKYYPAPFEYFCNPDHFDYLYSRSSLAELKGKDYQSKRNHTNRFRKKYVYEYVPLTPEVLPHCLELADKWCETHNCEEDRDLVYEQQSMQFAMKHFSALGLTGGALRVDGEFVAFTYGAPVNHDTFCIHIEKADTDFDGAYPVMNQEFASRIPGQYTYINREEDLGIPGLRKAKRSYHPVLLLEKCRAQLLED